MMRVYLIVILSVAANPLIQSFTDTAKETIRITSIRVKSYKFCTSSIDIWPTFFSC